MDGLGRDATVVLIDSDKGMAEQVAHRIENGLRTDQGKTLTTTLPVQENRQSAHGLHWTNSSEQTSRALTPKRDRASRSP